MYSSESLTSYDRAKELITREIIKQLLVKPATENIEKKLTRWWLKSTASTWRRSRSVPALLFELEQGATIKVFKDVMKILAAELGKELMMYPDRKSTAQGVVTADVIRVSDAWVDIEAEPLASRIEKLIALHEPADSSVFLFDVSDCQRGVVLKMLDRCIHGELNSKGIAAVVSSRLKPIPLGGTDGNASLFQHQVLESIGQKSHYGNGRMNLQNAGNW